MKSGLRESAAAIRAGRLSARSYCERLLGKIREREPRVQAWAAFDESRALALAQDCDDRRAVGAALASLHGIPVGVKDIVDTADLPTEMGSPIFSGNRPARNAPVIERLLAAGAYVLGKTVTTEVAFLHPGKTRNPWNPAHTPGGSSSGSAAAVAARLVPGAIGTQTNGSVIRPAAFCGVVGFKPGFGLVPIEGVLPFSPSLDQLGVFTRSVADAAALAAAIAKPGSITPDLRKQAKPPRIAFLVDFPWNKAEPEAAAQLKAVLARLAAAGATVAELALEAPLHEVKRVHRTIMFHEGARQHVSRQERHRASMSTELNAAIDDGMRISDEDYARALAESGEIRGHAARLFESCDVVASLPVPGAAPAGLGSTGDPSFCTLWSLTGFPSITIPTGLSAGGLPFGLQLAANAGGEDRLLRAAQWCEAAAGFSGSPFA